MQRHKFNTRNVIQERGATSPRISYPINSYQRKYTVIQIFNYLSKLSPRWGMQPIVQPTQWKLQLEKSKLTLISSG